MKIKLYKQESEMYKRLHWVDLSKVIAISDVISSDSSFRIYFNDSTKPWIVTPHESMTYAEIITKWQNE